MAATRVKMDTMQSSWCRERREHKELDVYKDCLPFYYKLTDMKKYK